MTYTALALFGLLIFLAICKRRAIKARFAKGWTWIESGYTPAHEWSGGNAT